MLPAKFNAWLMRRWYGDGPIGFLIPLAGLFVLVSGVRRWCYRHGILRVAKLPVPVIVVGNIAVGGSGKTPFAIWLAQALTHLGYHPGIITRGYGGKSTHWPLLITSQTDPHMAGDEAVLLASRTRVPVCAAPDRVKAAHCLLRHSNVDVIISDDGLQHYRLGRDVSVILLGGAGWQGNGWRLPAGPLRESKQHLREADLVICKSVTDPGPASPEASAFPMRLTLEDAVNLMDESRLPLVKFAGQRVHAVAGIGQPQQFFASLAHRGLQVDGHALPDHAPLSGSDLNFADGLPVLMTEKDAIKCRGRRLPNCWYVPATAEFTGQDADRILTTIRQRLKRAGDAVEKEPN